MKYIKKFIEVYLLFYFIIFTGFRYQVANPAILHVSTIILEVLLALWLLYMLVNNKDPVFPKDPAYYVVFGLAFLTSSIHSIGLAESFIELHLFSITALLFVGLLSWVKWGSSRKDVLNSLLWVGLIYNGIKIMQMASTNKFLLTCNDRTGLPNKTAGYVTLVLILSLSLFLNDRDKKKSLLPIIGMISSTVIIFFMGSRGGYGGAIAGILLTLFIYYVSTGNFKISSVIIIVSLVLVVPVVGTLVIRSNTCEFVTATGEIGTYVTGAWSNNINTRFELWDTAIQIIKRFPVFGAGPGTFPIFAKPRFDPHPTVFVHAHNLYLNVFAERGIVGLITGAGLIFIIVRTAFKRKDLLSKMIVVGMFGAVLVQGLVDVVLLEPFIPRFLFSIIAVLLVRESEDVSGSCTQSDIGRKGEIHNAENNK